MKDVKQFLHPLQDPLVIQYRVNAGFVPKTHWTQDSGEGGGRILGEVCHFVDLVQYLTESVPVKIHAESISSNNGVITDSDNIIITLKLKNGSLGIIAYTALGDTGQPKERIEVFHGNSSIVIDDFTRAKFYRRRRAKMIKRKGKGHKEEIEEFINRLKEGKPSPISFSDLVATTEATFGVMKSINKGIPIRMNDLRVDSI
jgi:polar amino acid transport system substrate-binding protein